MLNKDTDLIDYVIESIQKHPHHWVLENNELENQKAQITVNKLCISTTDDQGHPLVKSLDSIFGGTYNAILRHYNEYVVLLAQYRAKQFFPLDIYYQILEDIEVNFFNWQEEDNLIINKPLKIEINIDVNLFGSKSAINNLPINNEQAMKIRATFNEAKRSQNIIKKQNLVKTSLAQDDDLRDRLNKG